MLPVPVPAGDLRSAGGSNEGFDQHAVLLGGLGDVVLHPRPLSRRQTGGGTADWRNHPATDGTTGRAAMTSAASGKLGDRLMVLWSYGPMWPICPVIRRALRRVRGASGPISALEERHHIELQHGITRLDPPTTVYPAAHDGVRRFLGQLAWGNHLLDDRVGSERPTPRREGRTVAAGRTVSPHPSASRYGLRTCARFHAVSRMFCFSSKVGASRCNHQPILARAGVAITARLRSTPRRTSAASAAAE